jgi:hypothetical protein
MNIRSNFPNPAPAWSTLMRNHFIVALLAMQLAACSGGSGKKSGSPLPPPASAPAVGLVDFTISGTTDQAATVTLSGLADEDPASTAFRRDYAFGASGIPADPGAAGPTASIDIDVVASNPAGSSTANVSLTINP